MSETRDHEIGQTAFRNGGSSDSKHSKLNAFILIALTKALQIALAQSPTTEKNAAAPASKPANFPTRRDFVLGKWEPETRE